MKLNFENWIETTGINDNAKKLLNSGVICYKAGTHTAALLMSYLGFLVIMRSRIMTANKPPMYEQGKWDTLVREIQNEDKWEASLIDALKQQPEYRGRAKTRDGVFSCNDNIRAQIVYWKDRRNDCVHNKDNEITNAHVETFWSFLQSNLQKITVPGGKATLLNDFSRFFDSAYTPANSNVLPLILQIKESIEKLELPDFWKELFDVITNLIDYENEVIVTGKVLSLNDPVLEESLITYLKANPPFLLAYIDHCPSIIQQLNYDAQEIRNLWKTKLRRSRDPLKVYSSMLRNQLIPETEIFEANQHFAKHLKYTHDQGDHNTLKMAGFGAHLHQILFIDQNVNNIYYWKYLQEHHKVVRDYMEFYPLEDDVVKIITKEYNSSYHSYYLKDELEELFKKDSKKKQEYLDAIERLGLTRPAHLTF